MPALGRQLPEDQEFKANLGYRRNVLAIQDHSESFKKEEKEGKGERNKCLMFPSPNIISSHLSLGLPSTGSPLMLLTLHKGRNLFVSLSQDKVSQLEMELEEERTSADLLSERITWSREQV